MSDSSIRVDYLNSSNVYDFLEEADQEEQLQKSEKKKVISDFITYYENTGSNSQMLFDSIANYNSIINQVRTEVILPPNVENANASSESPNASSVSKVRQTFFATIPADLKLLGVELTELDAQRQELLDKIIDFSVENVNNNSELEKWQKEYLELNNKIAQKEAEFDELVEKYDVDTSSDIFKNTFSDYYAQKQDKKTEIDDRIKELQDKLKNVGAEIDDINSDEYHNNPELDKLWTEYEAIKIELSYLNNTKNIYTDDILSNVTTSKEIPEKLVSYANDIIKLTEKREQLIAQIGEESSKGYANREKVKQLYESDIECAKQILELQAKYNNESLESGVDLYNSNFFTLFLPRNLQAELKQYDSYFEYGKINSERMSLLEEIEEYEKDENFDPNNEKYLKLKEKDALLETKQLIAVTSYETYKQDFNSKILVTGNKEIKDSEVKKQQKEIENVLNSEYSAWEKACKEESREKAIKEFAKQLELITTLGITVNDDNNIMMYKDVDANGASIVYMTTMNEDGTITDISKIGSSSVTFGNGTTIALKSGKGKDGGKNTSRSIAMVNDDGTIAVIQFNGDIIYADIVGKGYNGKHNGLSVTVYNPDGSVKSSYKENFGKKAKVEDWRKGLEDNGINVKDYVKKMQELCPGYYTSIINAL